MKTVLDLSRCLCINIFSFTYSWNVQFQFPSKWTNCVSSRIIKSFEIFWTFFSWNFSVYLFSKRKLPRSNFPVKVEQLSFHGLLNLFKFPRSEISLKIGNSFRSTTIHRHFSTYLFLKRTLPHLTPNEPIIL